MLSLPFIRALLIFSNPKQAEIKEGNVLLNSNGSNLDIHQDSKKAIVNWQEFSIDKNETTNFIQVSKTTD